MGYASHLILLCDEMRVDFLDLFPGTDPRTECFMIPHVRACVEVRLYLAHTPPSQLDQVGSIQVACSYLNFAQLIEGTIAAGHRSSDAVRSRKSSPEIQTAMKCFQRKLHGSQLGAVALADVVGSFLRKEQALLDAQAR